MNQNSDNKKRDLFSSKDKKTIVVGVTGSIAAYKAAELVSQLRQRNYNVFVIMSADAKNFITPLTLQTLSCNPVLENFLEEEPGSPCGHIALADRADILLIAPATASTLARLAYGFSDDPLCAVALATHAPLLIAPAMNVKMWEHAATRDNVERLRARGAVFIGPGWGMLACGYEGPGRLIESSIIVDHVEKILLEKK
ncbi:MAG: phosphopantothenoylcysteine decarboxylase [Verrucomicrobia bacterium]|nr:MAG: phosphopantothenoylcysteine decarboxylase [Verrucomicrobiota bacterium]